MLTEIPEGQQTKTYQMSKKTKPRKFKNVVRHRASGSFYVVCKEYEDVINQGFPHLIHMSLLIIHPFL